MQWEKKGLIFKPSMEHKFCNSRVMCPTPFLLNDEVLRIYCGFCDVDGVSRIGFVDVNPQDPGHILGICDSPLLDVGEDGMFDDNGLAATSVFRVNDKVYMYYFAFQQGVKLPFYMFTGLAVSNDGGYRFKRMQKVPVLDRSDAEPIMRSGAFVMYDKEEAIFKTWYPSGNEFISVNGKKVHTYVLKYLESKNGVHWGAGGETILNHASDDEYGFGRPYIVKSNGLYEMYYSIRTFSKGYRLGYAISMDGKSWQRRDEEIGIDVSKNGWDSEMICYSSVISLKGRTYMFYNGNGLGKTGFGYAELVKQ